jgi:cyanophycinase-like exopeptidase
VGGELQGVLNRGGVVAGDSAGATVIGMVSLAIDLDQPGKPTAPLQSGLNLLRDAFVMAHANRYKPRVLALGSLTYVSAHPQAAGILIEEHTGIKIQRGQITRLIGNGRAGIVDGRSHETDSVVWLSGSARYDLRTRTLVQ